MKHTTMMVLASIVVLITVGTVQFMQLSWFDASTAPPSAVHGIVEHGDGTSDMVRDGATDETVSESAYRSLLPQTQDVSLSPLPRSDATTAPEITAAAAAVFDVASKKVLYEKNPEAIVSLASITKLMTALVVMDAGVDFDEEHVMQARDRREGGRIYLYNGDRVTRYDLLNAMLIGSANTATMALVHSLGMSEEEFVQKMNEKAYALGLRKTSFADPVGLNPDNRSTAFEVIELTRAALQNPMIQRVVLQGEYVLTTKQGSRRVISSTDQLLDAASDFAIAGGKTGYLNEAGYCFTGGFSDQNGEREIITVILGSETIDTRFSETTALIDWVYANYQWP